MITFITKIATITATMTTRLNTIIVFPIPSRFDRILIPKISPITKSTPHNGAKIFANAFRSYFINFPSMLRPLLCIHLYEISHGTGHRWICHFLLLSHQLTCMLPSLIKITSSMIFSISAIRCVEMITVPSSL